MTRNRSDNLMSATLVVHAPASPMSAYFLCRPPGHGKQYGPPHSTTPVQAEVTCRGCLHKLDPVHILTEPGLVTAWIGTGDPHSVTSDDAMVLVTAVRYTRAEGATFSGWVVRNERDGTHSDPIRLRADAVRQLRDMAAEIAPLYLDSVKA